MATTTQSKAIKITYTINPPSAIESDLAKEKAHEYPIVTSTSSSTPSDASTIAPKELATNAYAGYYTSLRSALEIARLEVGDELTKWRDVVGKGELGKEVKKGTVDDEDEGEEEEEG